MSNTPKRISKKGARRQFTTVGLALIVYILFVLIIPVVARFYFDNVGFIIPVDDYTMIVIFYALLLIGTLIPFSAIRRAFKVPFKEIMKSASLSLGDLIREFFMLFSVSSLGIFVAEGIANQLGVSMNLIFNIGSVASETYFDNYLYIFIFIVVSPIVEEIAFRGCMLKSLSRFGKVFSMIITSFIYALAHGSFIEMLPAFCISMMLCTISFKYHSVQPCIFTRIMFNAAFYGLRLVPEEYSLHLLGLLVAIYVITIIFTVRKKYTFVQFKTGKDKPWSIVSVFFTTPTVIFAILLFIADSVFIDMFF